MAALCPASRAQVLYISLSNLYFFFVIFSFDNVRSIAFLAAALEGSIVSVTPFLNFGGSSLTTLYYTPLHSRFITFCSRGASSSAGSFSAGTPQSA